MKPRYSEQILPVTWPFVISRFHFIVFREPTTIWQAVELVRVALFRWGAFGWFRNGVKLFKVSFNSKDLFAAATDVFSLIF